MEHADYDLLQSLSAHLRAPIGLDTKDCVQPIDEPLANFAINRHRVGSILYKASQNNKNIDETARSLLASAYKKNIYDSLAQKASTEKITRLFESHDIAFLVMKGSGLAHQLYDEPHIRLSKDIDILIPTSSSAKAIEVLNNNGFEYQSHSVRTRKQDSQAWQLTNMKVFKDLTFYDPQFSTYIELHQRLFIMEPKNLTAGFCNALAFQRTPSISNPHYCFYLILHGALCLWQRVKWVVDISLLVRKMTMPIRLKLMELAKQYDCEDVVISSLQFTEEIFAGSLDQDWDTILAMYNNTSRVEKLTEVYRQTLMTTSAEHPTLKKRKPIYFDAHYLLFGKKKNILKHIHSRIMLMALRRI